MITSAGMVKITPAAIEAAAEAPVLHDVVFKDVATAKERAAPPWKPPLPGIAEAMVSPANNPR